MPFHASDTPVSLEYDRASVSTGFSGANTAVTLVAPSTVMVSGLAMESTAPVQYEKAYPSFGTAVSIAWLPTS